MTSEQDIYRALMNLAQREQEAIVAGDVEQLTDLVEEKEHLIEHLNALETERMTALIAIEAATGLDADTATLSEIAAAMPADLAAVLVRHGNELKAQAIALREIHRVNEGLLHSSRTLIDRWIQYMRNVLAGSTYTASGGGGALPGGRTLDRSA